MKPYTEEFETFWIKFPARWNPNLSCYVKRKKRPAFIKWQKLSDEVRKECLSKVHLIKKYEGSASSVRDCVTWLNQCGWEDIQLEKPKPILTQYTPSIFQPIVEDTRSTSDKVNEQRDKLNNV